MIPQSLAQLYAFDWRIFMTAVHHWWHGGNPYGFLTQEFGLPGAFAYPPTALTWLMVFMPLGGAGFYAWTCIQFCGWWLLIRKTMRSQLMLLCRSPLIFTLLIGQSTFAFVLVLWGATLASRRGFWWGTALAWTMTKPQVALIPLAWILWHDRASDRRGALWLGILSGTAALALPPTLMNPGIWMDWLQALGDYRLRTLQMAPWQGFGGIILLAAFVLWYRSHRHNRLNAGWQWWLTAAVFPQNALYSAVVLLPALHPKTTYWTIAGLAMASILIGPATDITLPIILAGHILAAWFINGGPHQGPGQHTPTQNPVTPHPAQ